MYEDHSVAVVIPTYNESGFVGDVIETIPDFVDRIYPVDDCSTDGSWEEIRTAATRIDGDDPVDGDGRIDPDDHSMSTDGGTRSATEDTVPAGDSPRANGTDPTVSDRPTPGAESNPRAETDATAFGRRVVPLRHEENRGVGGAIKTGYQRARADRIDVTVVMGGDGQMDPDWMPALLDPVVDGRAAYAKANRLIVEEHHETMPRHRFVGNHMLTVLTKIATGYWSVGDPQHGYTAISLEALDTAGIDELYEFFGYCNDLLIRLSAANLRVADVPCPLTYADEESHIAYSSYIPRVSGMLLRSFLRRLWVDRDASGGRGRLALFVGGAIATVGGLLGVVASGLASSGPGDSRAAVNAQTAANDAAVSAGADEEVSASSEEAVDLDTQTDEHPDEQADEHSDEQANEHPDEQVDARDDESGAESSDADPEAFDSVDDRTAPAASSTDSSGVDRSSGYRSALLAIAGVAALLGAMLLDAVMNSNYNYTERIPEDAGPRIGDSQADDPRAAERE